MNKLLDVSLVNAIILIGFVILAVVVFVLISVSGKKRQAKDKILKIDAKKPKLKIKLPYLNAKEVIFLASMQNSLPSNYVAFPKVPMKEIVKPDGDLTIYNAIKNDELDVVIFKKDNMQPVCVIDLIDSSVGDNYQTKMKDYISKSLKSVSIPVIIIIMKESYEKLELLTAFLDVLDPISLAQLKRAK